jgi:hypothetical protein
MMNTKVVQVADTLELRFTRAEWMNMNNQTVLQSYLKLG